MSGGVAYVLDEDRHLYTRLNKEMVLFSEVKEKYDIIQLKDLIQQHVDATGSEKGKRILDNFEEYLPKFKKIIPHDYKKMMSAIASMEEKGYEQRSGADRSILSDHQRQAVSLRT